MKKSSRTLYPYIAILVIVVINWFVRSYIPTNTPTSFVTPTKISISPTETVIAASSEAVFVKKVIDGDTIQISTGQKVRYIGIDTPETYDTRKPHQCYGKEAAEKNKELVEGKQIRMEKDVSETDRYGRLLRYIYVIDPTTPSAELFVNEYLVKEGYAYAIKYPPDTKHDTYFHELQSEAQQNHKGLWSSCPASETGL